MTVAASPDDRFVGYKTSETVRITDKMVRQFADLSGDHNPFTQTMSTLKQLASVAASPME